jgi:antitoxin ParD1/3/4
MRNTSITISDHFDAFVSAQVRSGRYGSTSEVVRAGLRLLEEHEARVQALQDALAAGEASGDPAPFDFDSMKAKLRTAFDDR